MGLFSWLRSQGVSSPTDYDRAVVAALAEILPPDMAAKLRLRLNAIDAVDRQDEGHEVILHVLDGGSPVFPAHMAIFSDDRTRRFASVEALSLHAPSRGRAIVCLTNGNLAQIHYDRPTNEADPAKVTEWHARLLGPPFEAIGEDADAKRA
ncbi:hypothetical protein [Sphingomicrobium clamense]|uniref:Uncharacterized protein n=1 Tax=Sphingomicrobium clamense TaxID=2851013 RepID=A0ABS6V3V8_9SPHN|nr:hypothetical protein [Sphingomicrobium sp. B8]MBW0144231.1 hypothetical protein [Sphingomicrobium sp. B8]